MKNTKTARSRKPGPLAAKPKKSKAAKVRSESPLYLIKISLRGSKPLIWRRVVVRADMSLDGFDEVIQTAMGWTNSHLHHFMAGGEFYGTLDLERGDMDGRVLDEREYTLADIAPAAKTKVMYEYDFGDSWLHDVVVEKTLSPDASFKHPVCLGGAMACPPEDCGGLWGYYELLETLANPKHPDHAEMKEWAGKLDPNAFDLAATNSCLGNLKA